MDKTTFDYQAAYARSEKRYAYAWVALQDILNVTRKATAGHDPDCVCAACFAEARAREANEFIAEVK